MFRGYRSRLERLQDEPDAEERRRRHSRESPQAGTTHSAPRYEGRGVSGQSWSRRGRSGGNESHGGGAPVSEAGSKSAGGPRERMRFLRSFLKSPRHVG